MKNDYDSGKGTEDVSKLEKIIGECCKDVNEYKFIRASFSYYKNVDEEHLIGIDEKLLSEVENLSKYDKRYLSTLEMTVYHEIGHAKTYGKNQEYAFDEAIAELYAIDKGSIEDYIIEVAAISDIVGDALSKFNQTLKEPKEIVDCLLKHDGADKWKDKEFASKCYGYEFAKNALDTIQLTYEEIFDRVLKEREDIDKLKRKNNLFIHKDMISRK